jgi:hypothetical protein
LVERAPAPVLAIAADGDEENSFVFAADLARQLREQARIMLDHWADYNELYPPPPVGS